MQNETAAMAAAAPAPAPTPTAGTATTTTTKRTSSRIENVKGCRKTIKKKREASQGHLLEIHRFINSEDTLGTELSFNYFDGPLILYDRNCYFGMTRFSISHQSQQSSATAPHGY